MVNAIENKILHKEHLPTKKKYIVRKTFIGLQVLLSIVLFYYLYRSFNETTEISLLSRHTNIGLAYTLFTVAHFQI